MKVKDVMTPDVITVHPDTPLKEAAAILSRKGISGLVVMDDAGHVVGVLSEADILVKEGGERLAHTGILGWLFETGASELEQKLAARTVGEAMTSPALTIGPERPVHEAAARMIEDGVNRLPVLQDGRLLGIVTRADLVRAFTRTDEEIAEEIRTEIVKRTLWIAPEAVTVSVENGSVTLEGQVETATDAELLPVFVERVPGVIEVRSELSYRDRRPKERVWARRGRRQGVL